MSITFTQTLYRVQEPKKRVTGPMGLEHEIEKVLEQDDYIHIVKHIDGDNVTTINETQYLFYQRDDAFGVMQSVMRNLGLIEDGWDLEDIESSNENMDQELEADEIPESDDWRIVEEMVILNAQEA